MTRKDAQLLFDWLCRHYGYPANQNGLPAHRSQMAMIITSATVTPSTTPIIGCAVTRIAPMTSATITPMSGEIHITAAMIRFAALTNHGGTVLRCRAHEARCTTSTLMRGVGSNISAFQWQGRPPSTARAARRVSQDELVTRRAR